MKTKEDLNALKAKALSDDELAQVTGGYTQNSDGTYNLYAWETYFWKTGSGRLVFNVRETHLNATLDTMIFCDYFLEDANGNLDSSQYGADYFQVRKILEDYI